jgi:hypothetical protein
MTLYVTIAKIKIIPLEGNPGNVVNVAVMCTGSRQVGSFRHYSLHVARGSVVAKAYPMRWFFKINLILPAALSPGVYSASNRNEYWIHKNNNASGE